jgi:hypothetical protein
MGHVLLTPCELAAGVRDMDHVLLTPCTPAAGERVRVLARSRPAALAQGDVTEHATGIPNLPALRILRRSVLSDAPGSSRASIDMSCTGQDIPSLRRCKRDPYPLASSWSVPQLDGVRYSDCSCSGCSSPIVRIKVRKQLKATAAAPRRKGRKVNFSLAGYRTHARGCASRAGLELCRHVHDSSRTRARWPACP